MKNFVDPWFTVQELDSETFAISEYGHWENVHSFLLLGGTRAALIDTGLGLDSIKRITDQLTDLPIIVLTTHVHADHIGGHGDFDTIYVHGDDADWLINGIKGLSLEQIRKEMARDITITIPESFDPITYKPFQGYPDKLLTDGETIDLGNRSLGIYHTPGHSPGHISILDNETGYLFTGDLLYSDTPVYAFYPSTSPEDLVNSLEKIAKLQKVSKIYGGHNQLGLEPRILEEVLEAIQYLRENNLVRHGTGVHTFKSFSVQF
ncbi:glyoxylase-like metal-dependent hydrolase (beta-lactamase superfamily II) [Peribacillus simplex]|uniref:MBL fold metallo-hydrolase n=1 Tax=Peribacillus simplex TaxID=1478 RepID=UPI0024E1B0ED|nr:MBL fold metallo-hydrolase [Peribacillus simplex]MDF9762839.1 glyoxylase-like metal-dependent hydrolase (beta-lactamase superfamily II) [Peribacillus simplex]